MANLDNPIFDYKYIYIKRIFNNPLKGEAFWENQSIFKSILANEYFKRSFTQKEIVLLDAGGEDGDTHNSDVQYLVIDITKFVTVGGSVNVSINNPGRLSGVKISNFDDLFNLNCDYRIGDVLFEGGLYDRLMILRRNDERFEQFETWRGAVTTNKYVNSIFELQGLNITDWKSLFFGYIDSVGYDISRSQSISLSGTGMMKKLQVTHLNLIAAISDEFNLGTKTFSLTRPYSRMASWKIMLDLLIQSFNLNLDYHDIVKRVDKNDPSIVKHYPDEKGPAFMEISNDERVIARIEIIELEAYKLVIQKMQWFQNTMKTAYQIATEVADSTNCYLYDDADGVIYFRSLRTIFPPRIDLDYVTESTLLNELFKGITITEDSSGIVTGIIGTTSFIPKGQGEINIGPNKNLTMYINEFLTNKHGLSFKQVQPQYGFLIKDVSGGVETGGSNREEMDDTKKKVKSFYGLPEQKKILLDVHVPRDLSNIYLPRKIKTGSDGNYGYETVSFKDLYGILIDEIKKGFSGLYELVFMQDEGEWDQYLSGAEKLRRVKEINPIFVLQLRYIFVNDDLQKDVKIGEWKKDLDGNANIISAKVPYRYGVYLLSRYDDLATRNLSKKVEFFMSDQYYNAPASLGYMGWNVKENFKHPLYRSPPTKYSGEEAFSGKDIVALNNDLWEYADEKELMVPQVKAYKELFSTEDSLIANKNTLVFVPGSFGVNEMSAPWALIEAASQPNLYNLEYDAWYSGEYMRIKDMAPAYAKTLVDGIVDGLRQFEKEKEDVVNDISFDKKKIKKAELQKVQRALAKYLLAIYDSINSNRRKVSMSTDIVIPQWNLFDIVRIRKAKSREGVDGFERIYLTTGINFSIGIHKPGTMQLTLTHERFPIAPVTDEGDQIYKYWSDLYYKDKVDEILHGGSSGELFGGAYNILKDKASEKYNEFNTNATAHTIYEDIVRFSANTKIDAEELMSIILVNWDEVDYGFNISGNYPLQGNAIDAKTRLEKARDGTVEMEFFVTEYERLLSIEPRKFTYRAGIWTTGFEGFEDLKKIDFNNTDGKKMDKYMNKVFVFLRLRQGWEIKDIVMKNFATRTLASQIVSEKANPDTWDGKYWSPWGVFDYGNPIYKSGEGVDVLSNKVFDRTKRKYKGKVFLGDIRLPDLSENYKGTSVEDALVAKRDVLLEVVKEGWGNKYIFSDNFKPSLDWGKTYAVFSGGVADEDGNERIISVSVVRSTLSKAQGNSYVPGEDLR